jgi:hypothetical protein
MKLVLLSAKNSIPLLPTKMYPARGDNPKKDLSTFALVPNSTSVLSGSDLETLLASFRILT